MSQRERDRLVVLKKAQKKLITQRQAAVELQLSERQVRRLLVRLREVGDRAVVRGLRQRPSNRRLREGKRESAVRILSQAVYRGFGPTLASEYLARKHKIRIGRGRFYLAHNRTFLFGVERISLDVSMATLVVSAPQDKSCQDESSNFVHGLGKSTLDPGNESGLYS